MVFENISLTLQKGSLTYLQGKNGQGKTTLLKTIAYIMPATKGEILWNGKKIVDHLTSYRKDLFFLSNANSLYHSFNALENLRFFLSFYQKIEQKKILACLAEFQLEKFANTPLSYFSTGMKKKLLLVLMKLQQPKLLLLDEPDTGLDQIGQELLKELLQSFQQQGAILLLVSHQTKNLLPFSSGVLQLERKGLKNIG